MKSTIVKPVAELKSVVLTSYSVVRLEDLCILLTETTFDVQFLEYSYVILIIVVRSDIFGKIKLQKFGLPRNTRLNSQIPPIS
jgi:hypothetical protein